MTYLQLLFSICPVRSKSVISLMDILAEKVLHREVNKTDKVRCLYIDRSEIIADLPIHYSLDLDDLTPENIELYTDWDPCQELLVKDFEGKVFRPLSYNHRGALLRDDVENYMPTDHFRAVGILKKRLVNHINEYIRSVRFVLDNVRSAKVKDLQGPKVIKRTVDESDAKMPRRSVRLSSIRRQETAPYPIYRANHSCRESLF